MIAMKTLRLRKHQSLKQARSGYDSVPKRAVILAVSVLHSSIVDFGAR
jgi:hypothetical protein